jgi:hypothetical protein
MSRVWYLVGWGFVAVCGMVLFRSGRPDLYVIQEQPTPFPAGAVASAASGWFEAVRPHCNSLEVELQMQSSPPPSGWEGAGFGAACWAVAGRIDRARAAILEQAEGDREAAAGIVFAIGHPIADMGDDRSAGPIMQLVVEFQPWNYMARYHAGMSYYAIGRSAEARLHLDRFLEQYTIDDGWKSNAEIVLRRLDREGA